MPDCNFTHTVIRVGLIMGGLFVSYLYISQIAKPGLLHTEVVKCILSGSKVVKINAVPLEHTSIRTLPRRKNRDHKGAAGPSYG